LKLSKGCWAAKNHLRRLLAAHLLSDEEIRQSEKKKSGVKWVYRNGFWKKIGEKKNALDPQHKGIGRKPRKVEVLA